MWGLLRRAARADVGIDVTRLSRRLVEGSLPDELHLSRSAPIVVSTVHRAKGLEFDRVALVDAGWERPSDDDDDDRVDEAARTLFVAMSRTIESMVTVPLPDRQGHLERNRRNGRWVHTGWKYWQRRGIEVTPEDVDVRQPAGPYLLGEDAVEIQRLLGSDVGAGDRVELRFVRPRIGTPGATYSIVWEGRVIGLMKEDFGKDLVWVLKKASNWQYPKRITDLSIDAVRSVGGDAAIAEEMGLGPGGAWLAPSLVGMGRFEWKD